VAFWNKTDEGDLLRDVPVGSNRLIEPPKAPAPVAEASATHPTTVRSSLGPDTAITGKLSFSAPTRIDGKLKGEIRATDLLIIGEQAVVEGSVRAHKLLLYGQVQGDVVGVERVEIMVGGRLRGSVRAPVVIVCEGALLDGDCKIVPSEQKTATAAPPPAPKANARL